jgi:hypothetical protein
VSTKYFNVKNGLTTGDLLVSQSNVTLGSVSNLHIAGGTTGQFLKTDGNGILSFDSASSSPAPMPIIVDNGETLTIPEDYQGLFAYPLTVNGTLDIDGLLIDVSGQGPAGTVSQVQYNKGADFGATNGFTFDEVSGNLSVPGSVNVSGFLRLATYNTNTLRAITGSIGQLAVVSDSSPIGMPAYWDGTNNRWSFIHDNSAV